MKQLTDLKIYATRPHPCSYLDDREATTLFVDPDAIISVDLFSQLADHGFRRSGAHIYRPHCSACNACIPTRIPVDRFLLKRRHRRVLTRNADLSINCVESISGDEHFALYDAYLSGRHANGDMYPPERDQYQSFLADRVTDTLFVELRLGTRLLGVSVCDVMVNGLSAVYTFFDPAEEERGLGNFCILWQIEEARRRALPSLYLGYWIRDCRKMKYKIDYRPIELLINGRWVNLD